jgi:hypothetical protein
VTFTVDTHHHMLPDFFWRATNEGDYPVGGIAPPPWSRASALSFLDDAGIDVAVTAISTPGVHTGDDAAAGVLARRCNELAAELTRDHPDRYAGFACLPLPDVDGALAELAYALDDLRCAATWPSAAASASRPAPSSPTTSERPPSPPGSRPLTPMSANSGLTRARLRKGAPS